MLLLGLRAPYGLVARATPRMSTLTYEPPSRSAAASVTIIVGRKEALLSAGARSLLPDGMPAELWDPLVEKVKPGDAGASASTMYAAPGGGPAAACRRRMVS